VAAGATAKIQNRPDFSAVEKFGYQLDDVLRFCLVAVLIDPEIVLPEPFLEPVSFLGTGALL
jgi:hypothetical protein